jgi:hypothetical protein
VLRGKAGVGCAVSLDAQPFGFATGFHLSTVGETAPLDDCQFLFSGGTADLSDDHDLFSLKELLARSKQVTDLALDDDDDDNDITSRISSPHTADDHTTSKNENLWTNVPLWASSHRKLQQRLTKPLQTRPLTCFTPAQIVLGLSRLRWSLRRRTSGLLWSNGSRLRW